jgi:putative spermidine/putrescine transport system ATP-binding protein
VLSHGHLEQFGTPSEIYDQPQTLFVNTFVGTANRVTGTVIATDADGVKVALDAGGEIIARAPKPVRASDKVIVCLRPEHLTFVSDDSGFAGEIGMALPLGATVVHEIKAKDGSSIKISQARTGGTPLREAGTPVRVAPLAPGLATVFPQ